MQLRNQCVRIIFVFVYPFNIREEYKFFCMYCFCDRTCCIICIDIIRIKVCVITNRKYDRKEISFQKILQNLRIYFFDITNISNILSIGKFLVALKQSTVFSADTDCLHTKRFHQSNQFFIYLCKNHFCNFHGILVCYAKAIDKTRFHADFVNPAANFLTTAMNDDRFESDQFQKNNIFNDICLQFFIQHGTSTIFYYYDLTIKTLYIRKSLNKSLGLVQIFLIYHFYFSSLYILKPVMTCNPH